MSSSSENCVMSSPIFKEDSGAEFHWSSDELNVNVVEVAANSPAGREDEGAQFTKEESSIGELIKGNSIWRQIDMVRVHFYETEIKYLLCIYLDFFSCRVMTSWE